jgi:hypothetical protein
MWQRVVFKEKSDDKIAFIGVVFDAVYAESEFWAG